MRHFSGSSITDVFRDIIASLISSGLDIAPRGLPTLEFMPACITLTDPRRRVIVSPSRKINPAFAIAETIWILSGTDDAWIYDYNRRLRRYADDGILAGAYGPRLRRWQGITDQLRYARDTLLRDRNSRQAVIQIYDPGVVRSTHRDVPCTIGYRFFIRGGRLSMITTMRSQDVWLGLPYDIFANTVLLELLAGWVGAEVGHYHHMVDSLHLYRSDIPRALAVIDETALTSPPCNPISIAWDDFEASLLMLVHERRTENQALAEFCSVLTVHKTWTEGHAEAARAQAETLGGALGLATRYWLEGKHGLAKTGRG